MHNTEAAFKTIKDLTRSNATRTTVIEDKNGNLITEKAAISNRWKEYCEELCNYQLIANVPVELLQNGGQTTIEAYTNLCSDVWSSEYAGVWPSAWTQSLIISLPKKGNLQS